jgi:flagellar biogenesis protein FliO
VSSIDLSNPPPNHKYSVSIEREETDGERRVRLFKDVALFVVAIAFVVLIAWLCVSTLLSATATAEEKKWAMSVISAATGGIVGYLLRK